MKETVGVVTDSHFGRFVREWQPLTTDWFDVTTHFVEFKEQATTLEETIIDKNWVLLVTHLYWCQARAPAIRALMRPDKPLIVLSNDRKAPETLARVIGASPWIVLAPAPNVRPRFDPELHELEMSFVCLYHSLLDEDYQSFVNRFASQTPGLCIRVMS